MKFKLTVAYDGTPFSGWQSQADGNAVQDHLERAVVAITGERAVVHGSGRTDAGVHALGQTAHFEVTQRELSAEKWLGALNANLPRTIRILKCQRAKEDFHARFSAKGKTYRYRIFCGAVLPPHELGRCWQVPRPIDSAALVEAGRIFEGRHDFAAFAANRGKPDKHTVRTIYRIGVTRKGSLIELTFTGEGFLYKMIRLLSGAMVGASSGRETLEGLRERLEMRAPKWNYVAPAEGLYLVRVAYAEAKTVTLSPR